MLNQDQDFDNLLMKPKGIEIFQHDLMSREEESKHFSEERPTTYIDTGINYIQVENQHTELSAALPEELQVRDSAKLTDFNIDPKSSIFTSSQNQAENSLMIESANRNITKDTARNDAMVLSELSSAMQS